MTALLEAVDVTTGYGELEIVHGVSIDVSAGEIVTIIGPNGAGKSTLLKSIAGVLPKFAGTVRFAGEDVTGLNAPKMVALGASFVPQTNNVFPSLTIRENLEMGGYQRSSDVATRVAEVLALFPELERRPGEHASNLSGGQRQALAIGRALMLDPTLLMLDEPTAALSPVMRQAIFAQVLAIRGRGVAVLMVEQNAKESLAISDRGYVLVAGRGVLEESGAEMLANADVGRLFLGLEPAGGSS